MMDWSCVDLWMGRCRYMDVDVHYVSRWIYIYIRMWVGAEDSATPHQEIPKGLAQLRLGQRGLGAKCAEITNLLYIAMLEHLPNLWGSGDAMESSDGFVRSGFEKVDSTPANQEAGMDFMNMDWTTERSSAGFRVESDRHRIIAKSVLVLLRFFLLYLVFTVPKPGSTNVDSC